MSISPQYVDGLELRIRELNEQVENARQVEAEAAMKLGESLIKIGTLEEQVEKLTKERDEAENPRAGVELGLDCANASNSRLLHQLAALAEQNEKLRALVLRYRTTTPLGNQPYMIAGEADAALSLPDLAAPVLNRIRADFAEELAQTVWIRAMEECKRRRQNPAEANDLFTACAVIRAKADELENSK